MKITEGSNRSVYDIQWLGKYWFQFFSDCVHASGVNVFKNRIDTYLVKAGYTWNKGRLQLE